MNESISLILPKLMSNFDRFAAQTRSSLSEEHIKFLYERQNFPLSFENEGYNLIEYMALVYCDIKNSI